MQQTPVSDSYEAGSLVLATVTPPSEDKIPSALAKVRDTDIALIKPTPEKIPQLVDAIRSALEDESEPQPPHIAPSQDVKIAFGRDLVQRIHQWCQDQDSQYREQLQNLASITVECQSIGKGPLNLRLAEYLDESRIKSALELDFMYKKVRIESSPLMPILMYQTRDVLDAITEKKGYYDSLVAMTIRAKKSLLPVCAMVIAIIPATFGLYLLRYSCSTKLGQRQCMRCSFAFQSLDGMAKLVGGTEPASASLKQLPFFCLNTRQKRLLKDFT